MYSLIKKNCWFLTPYTILATFCFTIILLLSKSEIHLFLNSWNNTVGDFFFKHITWLGDGLSIPFLILLMIFIRFRYAILLLMTYAISGIFAQLLKRVFFQDIVRPVSFFHGKAQLHLVEGIEQLTRNSFPSGHSTTAFAIMLCFAMMVNHKGLKLLFFILACLIAYSRVYLSQHFLVDILAGSLIGTITTLICFWQMEKWNAQWLDKNLIHLK